MIPGRAWQRILIRGRDSISSLGGDYTYGNGMMSILFGIWIAAGEISAKEKAIFPVSGRGNDPELMVFLTNQRIRKTGD
jgi:hypothetical protein